MKTPRPPRDLLAVLAGLDDADAIGDLLVDLLTPAEVDAIAERWAIVKALAEGHTQRAVRDAALRSGIGKRVTCHTFRHSFATELLRSRALWMRP